LTRIDPLDLNLFDFDYDLTFMVFFLDADEKIYARYGSRDADSPDSRQSLDGLRYTMESVLRAHAEKVNAFAPKGRQTPRYLRDINGSRGFARGCYHCHQVKEALNDELRKSGKWERDMVWRYPLPENLGLLVEVNRGNLIKEVKEHSPAADAGLKAGDLLQQLNNVPIHSIADIQYALDRAPKTGTIEAAWLRGDKPQQDKITLPEGWRKTDLSWRPSMRDLIPLARVYGPDLTAEEKKALGLSARHVAFRQNKSLSAQARAAGVRTGDIILGVDDKTLETDVDGFLRYVERNYLVGDKVTLNIIRGGERQSLTMTLLR
jgi:predicted metalloprotease with PDZ domain